MRAPRPSIVVSVALAGALAALLPDCKKADPGGGSPSGSAAPSASAASDLPPTATVRHTTSGEIALGNLNGQIRVLEAQIAAGDPGGKRRRQLVDLLSVRGDMAGRIADLERAVEIAEALPGELPDSAEVLLTRASMRAALHRFDEAWSDLDEAERRGAPPAQTRGKRASILDARGRTEEALALASEARRDRPGADTTGFVAALLGELGRRDEALAAFREAFESVNSTSPFPVAWLFFRQGEFWEREGRKDLAITYYQAASERLPAYAHAAAHHARLAPADRAEALLRPLAATSDDPEIDAVLAEKLKERGDAAGAQAHAAKAATRYDELVQRHPAAFADHAARFWLDVGGDPKKALDLAKRNLQFRKTPRSYQLAVLAALEAGDRKTACDLGTEGLALPRLSSLFRDTVKGACEPR
jgi:tetratricopeptide (TPR) repeat protein